MAAFVHPRVGGKVLKASGYKTESYKPPLVNPCDITTADRYMTRMPGEDLYSGETPAQRSAQQLMEEYSRLNDATTRREEWMAVQAIVTGQVPVVGEGVNEIIDFAKGLFLNLTQEELPRHGKKKHKYKKVKKNKSASRAPAGESIEQRPEKIDGREEFGHWEGDTVYSGKGKRKTTRALLTLTERKTRKEIIIAIPNRKAETVVKALDALERKLGARRFRAIFKSITFDNGTEFAAAEELERSCINKHLPRTKVYFCHPYSSWERGTNENTNGMIRRRFPKGTNFAAVTNAQIVQAENWINNYPRKILGYKSSEIVFRECLRELGIAA